MGTTPTRISDESLEQARSLIGKRMGHDGRRPKTIIQAIEWSIEDAVAAQAALQEFLTEGDQADPADPAAADKIKDG